MGSGCGRKLKSEITGTALNIRLVSIYKMASGKKFTIFTSPTLMKIKGNYLILSYEQDGSSWNVVLTAVAQLFRMEIYSVGRKGLRN